MRQEIAYLNNQRIISFSWIASVLILLYSAVQFTVLKSGDGELVNSILSPLLFLIFHFLVSLTLLGFYFLSRKIQLRPKRNVAIREGVLSGVTITMMAEALISAIMNLQLTGYSSNLLIVLSLLLMIFYWRSDQLIMMVSGAFLSYVLLIFVFTTEPELFLTFPLYVGIMGCLTAMVSYNTFKSKVSELMHVKELEEKRNAMEQKNFELDQFVYKASHDIRSPLASIMGLLYLIKKEGNLAAIREYIQMADERAKKLDAFLKTLLDFSRSSNVMLDPEPIDFNKLYQDCLDDLTYVPNNDGVEKVFQIMGDTSQQFYSDRLKLKILLQNLISNSIKYARIEEARPRVIVTVSCENNTAKINVIDNGLGIPESQQEHIYNMFYRAHEGIEGTGLGLYIVKQIVMKLKGDILVSSKEGQGSSFFITLPDGRRV